MPKRTELGRPTWRRRTRRLSSARRLKEQKIAKRHGSQNGEDHRRRTRPPTGESRSKAARSHAASDAPQPAGGRHLKSVRVGRTTVGKGVFARKRYACESVIGEIEGEFIHSDGYGSDYCMDVGNGDVLEPAPPFRYLNHCCDPNCEFDCFDLEKPAGAPTRVRVFLLALRDIAPGEELTIDYHWAANAAIPCRCGAASCRGWIVDAAELPAVLKRCQGSVG